LIKRLARNAVLAFLVTFGFSSPSVADLADRASRAAQAGDIPRLKNVVRDTAEVLGATELSASVLESSLRALESADSGLKSWRERRETEIGDDEAALDDLYGSRQWMEIDHLAGEIDYWKGWVLYRLGHIAKRRGDGKTRQRGYFRGALRAFGRALPRIRDPNVGRETLLAVASIQRELGKPKNAATTLDRLGRVFADAPAEFHRRVVLERARSAADSGDLKGVLTHTRGASEKTGSGKELLMLRVEAILAGDEPEKQLADLRAAAVKLLGASGKAPGQVVAHLASADLSGKTLVSLNLGAVSEVLAGLAFTEESPEVAASFLDRALSSGKPLPGLRREVLWARLAEARFREENYELSYRACDSFRSQYPKSEFRSNMARLSYDSAKAWEAAGGGAASSRAVASASKWVARDAPDSAEADQVQVTRALSRAAASRNPNRAIRLLNRVPMGAAGVEAVALQKVLVLSAKVQGALERALRKPTDVRGPTRELTKALGGIRNLPKELQKTYAQDIGVANVRQLIGEGKSTKALERLLTLNPDFEAMRTRLMALWRVGRKGDAQHLATRILSTGPGAKKSRWELAALVGAVAPEDAPNPAVQAKLLKVLRDTRPKSVEGELVADLILREAEASLRAGDAGLAKRRLEEVVAANPRALRTLHGTASLYESLGNAGAATQVWHHASKLSEPGSPAWAKARVGVARTLRLVPEKAGDGCAVAESILASGRELDDTSRNELTQISASCVGG